MKIGIDARFFGPRVGGGGLGRYVSELVTHLQKIDQRNQYILFLKKENFHECKITNKNFSKQLIDIPWYSIEEQRKMPGGGGGGSCSSFPTRLMPALATLLSTDLSMPDLESCWKMQFTEANTF